MHPWSAGKLGGITALLSACMILAAVPMGFVTGSGAVVTNLLFDAPLLLLPTMLVMNWLLRSGHSGIRRGVLVAGLVGWSILLFDTLVYDLIPLLGFATDEWANMELTRLLPIRNGLIFASIGGWMVGCGILWRTAAARLPKSLGWLHIVAGSPWIALAIISWGMIGGTGKLSELPPILMAAIQALFLVFVVVYFGWALTFGLWLRKQSHIVGSYLST
jgi:hypothetical protein